MTKVIGKSSSSGPVRKKRVVGKKKVTARAESPAVCVLVLGMHRSGTSALSRVLNLAGCSLPKSIMKPNAANEAGYWESAAICGFNDRLLESGGSSWSDWPVFNPTWIESPTAGKFFAESQQILSAEFPDTSLFLLKDPRICRITQFWLEALDRFQARVCIVIPVRNPLEVAASLEKRDNFDPHLGMLLWLGHVLDAEAGSRGRDRVFLTYDGLMKSWGRIINRFGEKFGPLLPRLSEGVNAEIDEFINERYRHHSIPAASVLENPMLSEWIREVFGIFVRWDDSGESSADWETLDRIRAQLALVTPLFGRLVASGEQRKAQLLELLPKYEDARAKAADVMRVEAEARASQALAAEKSEELRLINKRARGIAAELQASEDRCLALQGQLQQVESSLAQRSLEAEQSGEQLSVIKRDVEQLETDRQALDAEVQRQLYRAALLDATVAELRNELAKAEEAAQERDVRMAEQIEECVVLTRLLASAESEADSALTELRSIQERHDSELNAANTDREQLRTELDSSKNSALQLDNQLRNVESRLKERFAEVAALTSMVHEQEVEWERRWQEQDSAREAAVRCVNQAIIAMIDAAAPKLLPSWIRVRRQIAVLKQSTLFDADWYLRTYPDVGAAGLQPERHFIVYGVVEGRAPNGSIG